MAMARGCLAGMTIGAAMLLGAPAVAMPESCQKDFAPMMQQRANYMSTINGYKNRKPSAPQACSTFGGLAAINRKIVTWMDAQKDWCQVPDEMISQLKGQQGQIDKVRGQACGAAAKQAQMMKQARRAQQQQRQAGPSVGGGVRLPQGAL